jgi:hypothetical protein
VVTFHRLSDESSREIEHESEGVIEKVGSALGVSSRGHWASLRTHDQYLERNDMLWTILIIVAIVLVVLALVGRGRLSR